MFSVLTIIAQVIALVIMGCLIGELLTKRSSSLLSWCARHGILLMLIVAAIAMTGSLFFSEIAQWVPCKDCWLQRICMYPQVVLLAIALWKKDSTVARYILALSIIGMVIAVDHYSDQVHAAFFPQPDAEGVNILLKPCDASGVSCAQTQIQFAFGYITIPMMALSAFVLNALGSMLLLRKK
jgi:disulfide bond formation protein DsbB